MPCRFGLARTLILGVKSSFGFQRLEKPNWVPNSSRHTDPCYPLPPSPCQSPSLFSLEYLQEMEFPNAVGNILDLRNTYCLRALIPNANNSNDAIILLEPISVSVGNTITTNTCLEPCEPLSRARKNTTPFHLHQTTVSLQLYVFEVAP